jgi:gliding motility-associated-like protein
LQCTSDTTIFLFNYLNSDINTSEDVTQCDSYTWNGQTYTTSGTYQFLGTTALGCDSIATLNLTIHPSTGSQEQMNACDDYTWNGQTYTTSGSYTFLTQTINGCDSLLTLNLAVNSSFNTVLNETICDGEVVTLQGTNYTTSGTYPILLQSQAGCDSTVVLELTVLPVPQAPLIQYTAPECPGDQVDIWVAAGPDSIGWSGPNGFSSEAYTNSFSMLPEHVGTYFAWLHADGCYSDTSAQDIQIAYVFELNKLQLPNIITPNGDGVNDQFDLTAMFQNCVGYDLVIINRWGQPVYSGNQDSPFFDGTTGGVALETGVYFYKLRLLDAERSGFVQVSR